MLTEAARTSARRTGSWVGGGGAGGGESGETADDCSRHSVAWLRVVLLVTVDDGVALSRPDGRTLAKVIRLPDIRHVNGRQLAQSGAQW